MKDLLVLRDSITDSGPVDAGKIVLSGSHGGLSPVVFNDAGIGLEDAGIGGIMALDGVGMAAAGVDCLSARIGDARDALERGRISAANQAARALGVDKGMPVSEAVALLHAAPLPSASLPPYREARTTRTLRPGAPPGSPH